MNDRDIVYEAIMTMSEAFVIKDSSYLKDDLGLCSFDMMSIIVMIEKKTNKCVDIELLGENPTVLGLINSLR